MTPCGNESAFCVRNPSLKDLFFGILEVLVGYLRGECLSAAFPLRLAVSLFSFHHLLLFGQHAVLELRNRGSSQGMFAFNSLIPQRPRPPPRPLPIPLPVPGPCPLGPVPSPLGISITSSSSLFLEPRYLRFNFDSSVRAKTYTSGLGSKNFRIFSCYLETPTHGSSFFTSPFSISRNRDSSMLLFVSFLKLIQFLNQFLGLPSQRVEPFYYVLQIPFQCFHRVIPPKILIYLEIKTKLQKENDHS